ncbi:MAG: family 78 glycoside hydrolase catalytic domain [Massiliimalia sp.]|jgi:alpha-L-rhamnosidase
MRFSEQFICATHNYADYNRQVSAPYLRKSFQLDEIPQQAELVVTGLGFYRLFVNGKEITKGILAPYISNPDHLVYYDRYDLSQLLRAGENVIGLILGNGMQNCFGGYVWDFDKARWRGAPMTALWFCAKMEDGREVSFEADSSFKTHDSPVIFNDLRMGETYDARLEIPGWCEPGFDDRDWEDALPATAPRGELRLCEAEPIVSSQELRAVSIIPYQEGYLYDFGINTAGRIRLCVTGTPGQEIVLEHGEWYHDGILDRSNINFADRGDPRAEMVQRSRYVCRGEGEEVYAPYFSYYGFRYVYVKGITKEQAVAELLTYEVMHSDLKERGSFSCSNETANLLQLFTRRSTLANFFYFPTDCPHREKNGWTGDAALSAEHTLLNLNPETSYREWLRSIRAAQDSRGALPGIVPTGGWGFEWGNGPAWDCVLTYLPYFTWRYRGDTQMIRENATAIFRYLHFLTTLVKENGLIDYGLGDWCPPGRGADDVKSPLIFTSSVISMDIARKAAELFEVIGWTLQKEFAQKLAENLRRAVRRQLVDYATMTAMGACQTSQAMAIFYDIFEPGEKPEAFARLLELIEDCDGHMDCGILGARVIFHVLSAFGHADLAFHMITRPDYPSYGNWVARGATCLWEDFQPVGGTVASMDHHFFGDISSWFIQSVCGIVVNPKADDCNALEIAPHFVSELTWAEASHLAEAGKVSVRWERDGQDVVLTLEVPEGMHGYLYAPKGWLFPGQMGVLELKSGEYRLCPV